MPTIMRAGKWQAEELLELCIQHEATIARLQATCDEQNQMLYIRDKNIVKLRGALSEIIKRYDYQVAHELIDIARAALKETK